MFALVAACASTPAPGTRPHDMTVDEHMKLAARHGAEASAVAGTGTGTASGSSWYPWYYYWDPAAGHEELARAHARAGVELELEVRKACAGISDRDTTSPLADATRVERIERWVVFHLSNDAGPPDRVLARLRCERTRMMQMGASDRDRDPTCLPGVVWTAHAGSAGVELMATAPDAAGAVELVRRATREAR